MNDSKPFSCFGDFWQLTQDLDEFQRNKLLNSLPEEDKNLLVKDTRINFNLQPPSLRC